VRSLFYSIAGQKEIANDWIAQQVAIKSIQIKAQTLDVSSIQGSGQTQHNHVLASGVSFHRLLNKANVEVLKGRFDYAGHAEIDRNEVIG